jgi:hypothetical protein
MNPVVLRRFSNLGVLFVSLGTSVWLGAVAARVLADQVTVDCRLRILREGTNAVVFWQLPPEDGQELVLQSASSVGGPWIAVTNAAQPFTVLLNEGKDQFFRTVLVMPVGSANASQIAQWIRDFAFSSIPQLFWNSGGFPNVDLFLSRRPDGEIAVVSGEFEGFNRWLEPKDYGQIDETDPLVTKLMGLDGSVLATLLPTDPGQPGAAPTDDPATPLGNSDAPEGDLHR